MRPELSILTVMASNREPSTSSESIKKSDTSSSTSEDLQDPTVFQAPSICMVSPKIYTQNNSTIVSTQYLKYKQTTLQNSDRALKQIFLDFQNYFGFPLVTTWSPKICLLVLMLKGPSRHWVVPSVSISQDFKNTVIGPGERLLWASTKCCSKCIGHWLLIYPKLERSFLAVLVAVCQYARRWQ